MKRGLMLLLMAFILLVFPTRGFTEAASPANPSIHDRITQETKEFDPEKVGQQMEAKAGELMEMTKGGSLLYVAFALFVFVLLLFIGLFYRPVLKVAFLVLILAVLVFLVIQNWEAVLNGLKGIFRWLGSEAKPTAPPQEGTASQGSPI